MKNKLVLLVIFVAKISVGIATRLLFASGCINHLVAVLITIVIIILANVLSELSNI